MYPMTYFQNFRQLSQGSEVFVAMPMRDSRFLSIWDNVYIPAIESLGLTPFRVDIPQTGDSILIEILRGLRGARLVLADISPDCNSGIYPNANVMYELGIAHSIRLPETVLVFRGKGSVIPFDVSHPRVFEYDQNDDSAACESVRAHIESALGQAKQLSDDLVESVWLTLDPVAREELAVGWYVVSGRAGLKARERGEQYHQNNPGLIEYPMGNVTSSRAQGGELRAAYQRLLDLGLFEQVNARWERIGSNSPKPLCRFTQLGEVVADRFTKVD